MIDLKNLKFADLLGDVEEPAEPVNESADESAEQENESTETGTSEKASDTKPAGKDKEPEEPEKPEEASEPEKPEESEEESSVIEGLATKLGYEFEENEKYEDNEEGLGNFVVKASEKLAGKQLLEFFEQFPDVEEYTRYRMNGGDPAKYFDSFQNVDLGKVELKEDDEATQKAVLNQFLSKQGFDATEVNEMITDYSDTGLLFKHAKSAQTKLVKMSETERQNTIKEQQKLKDKEVEESKKLWQDIEATVETGVLKGVQIPETEKKKFFEWMAKPVDSKGRSARDVQREKIDIETMVALEYLLYKNMDLEKLVRAKAQTINAQELRKRLGGSTPKKPLSGTGTAPAHKPDQLPSFKDLL